MEGGEYDMAYYISVYAPGTAHVKSPQRQARSQEFLITNSLTKFDVIPTKFKRHQPA